MKKVGKDNNSSLDNYKKLINKITQLTKNDNSSYNQNRQTMPNNNIIINEKNEINQYNQGNSQGNNIQQQQRIIFEKMNQKLINNRRNVNWENNQQNNNININGNNSNNRNNIDSNKIFIDNRKEYPLGGGKNAPIVNILNERNNQSQYYPNQSQNINISTQNNYNNYNNHFNQNPSKPIINSVVYTNIKSNTNINPNYNTYPNYKNYTNNNDKNSNYYYQTNNNNNKDFPKKVPENSKNNMNYPNFDNNRNNNNPNHNILIFNPNEEVNNNPPTKNNTLCTSLLYGLIFGSLGTLLLWLKNPKVREYLKSCYQNINSESILNFFKCFLHPIDSIKSLGENIGSFQDILKESLNYLYQFIDDYSDLWRLLGVIAMIFIFWLIIKKIIKMFKKNDKKKKNTNENFNINC